jgi:dTDP-4-dehydrorhamnose reductase
MTKTILITGSNGLLGQKLIYSLKKNIDVKVIATSLGENRMLDKTGYVYESLDITNASQVNTIIKKHLPDTIINTAAMTNVDACEAEKAGCWALNVTAVDNLLKGSEAISQQKQIHFIHLSTDFIFNGKDGPYKEEDAPDPLSYYAESKVAAEKLVQSSSVKWAILRTMLVYGTVDNMSRSNIVLWAKDALSKKQEIKVVDDQFRNPTLAEDLSDACILAAMKGAEGIYHISGKDFMSINELVYAVAEFFNLDTSLIKTIKSDTLNQAAKRPARTGFIIDKACRDLNYQPHSFKEGLAILAKQIT